MLPTLMKHLLKIVLLALFFVFVSCGKQKTKSQLDHQIPPEVKNDALYHAIHRLAKEEPLSTILEIGSSSGQGSTEAFVTAIRENPSHPTLFCIEVSKRRFSQLKKHYEKDPFVRCYNVSSIPLELFPKEEEVSRFYNNVPSKLNRTPLPTVLQWLKQDIDYLKREGVPQKGIELIRRENGIENFDMVFIDGSEFTGMAEFDQIYGARYILLDDTCTFKNYLNRERLLKDPNYTLIEENPNLRNGYAIFKRIKF